MLLHRVIYVSFPKNSCSLLFSAVPRNFMHLMLLLPSWDERERDNPIVWLFTFLLKILTCMYVFVRLEGTKS